MAKIKRKGQFGGLNSATVSFKWNGTDSSGAANSATGTHGTGVYLPSGATLVHFHATVNTTFTSATDAAKIGVGVQTLTLDSEDVIAAIAISDGTNMWDAGNHAGKIGFPNYGADTAHDSQVEVAALHAASFLTLTAEREIRVTVQSEALTAGEVTLKFIYFL